MNPELNPVDINARLKMLEMAVGSLNDAMNETTETVAPTTDDGGTGSTPITEYGQQNLIRNGDCGWSRDTYLNDTPSASTDVDAELMGFFSSASDGSDMSEDTTDDASPSTSTAIKSSDHSAYSSDDPAWDKENGWIQLGSTSWICAPFPKNFIVPSRQYFLSFIYKLADSVGYPAYQAPIFAGLWDNTPGQQKFIEGGDITLNATFHDASGIAPTTTREYFVIFEMGSGITYGSTTTSLLTPQDGFYVTNSIYVYLEWDNEPAGAISKKVYRNSGGLYRYLGDAYPSSSFRDNGNASDYTGSGSGYPAVTYTKETAYILTNSDNFAPALRASWQPAQFNIPIPGSYDQSLTTGTQWLVIGLLSALPLATRGLLIDLISIDDKFGNFTRCPLDFLAKRQPSSTPSSGNQGTTGTGGETPPIEGGGTGYCPTFDMPVLVEDKKTRERFEISAIDLVHNEDKYGIVNRKGRAVKYSAEVSPRKVVIYEMVADNGKTLKASSDHPCFVDEFDRAGKPLSKFRQNDVIEIQGGQARVIVNIRKLKREQVVRISILGSREKGFWINGFGGHNLKPFEEPGPI